MADMPVRLYRLEVSKGAKLVLSYLWRYAGRERFVWVGRETIASDLGIESERTLRRHLGELRKAGVIEEDTQVRSNRVRTGWWLRDGSDVDGRGVESDVGRDSEDVVDQAVVDSRSDGDRSAVVGAEDGGQNWPGADKTDRGRTKLAAEPDKNGRPISIELKRTNSLCVPKPVLVATRNGDDGGGRDRDRAGFELLRRWRVHGGDPDGLGPWPRPRTPNGMELPQLPMAGKLEELLRQERTPEELHQAVHLVAGLVEDGVLPASKWRATYVFSGWLEELVVKALELRAKRAWKQGREVGEPEVREVPFALDEMFGVLEESKTLRSRTGSGDEERRRKPMRAQSQGAEGDDYLALLDVRSQVQAIAEELGRDPEEVLKALGRRSIRDVKASDGQRLQGIYAALDKPRPHS